MPSEDGGHATCDTRLPKRGSRDAEGESGPAARLVAALEAVRAERGDRVAPADLLAALASRPDWGAVKTTRRLATLLGPLGLTCRQVRDKDRRLCGATSWRPRSLPISAPDTAG